MLKNVRYDWNCSGRNQKAALNEDQVTCLFTFQLAANNVPLSGLGCAQLCWKAAQMSWHATSTTHYSWQQWRSVHVRYVRALPTMFCSQWRWRSSPQSCKLCWTHKEAQSHLIGVRLTRQISHESKRWDVFKYVHRTLTVLKLCVLSPHHFLFLWFEEMSAVPSLNKRQS